MAYQANQEVIGNYLASTSFASTDQYCAVFFSSSGGNNPPDVRITDTEGMFANGILDDLGAETSGSAVRVVVWGQAKARFGSTHAAVTVNAPLYAHSNGTIRATSSSSFYPLGWSLEPLAADTSGIISIFVNPERSARST